MCPLVRGSTVHKEEWTKWLAGLSIVDKMAGPNVSFIRILGRGQPRLILHIRITVYEYH